MSDIDHHLTLIKCAQRDTEAVFESLEQIRGTSDKALVAAKNLLFDLFTRLAKCRSPKKIEILNASADVLYKLAKSALHLQDLEFNSIEFVETRAQLKESIRQAPGLPDELRAQIERELNLLG